MERRLSRLAELLLAGIKMDIQISWKMQQHQHVPAALLLSKPARAPLRHMRKTHVDSALTHSVNSSPNNLFPSHLYKWHTGNIIIKSH